MKKIVIIFCVLMCTTLSANAFGMKSTMNRLMDSWVGENINTVVNQWGYPNDTKDVAGRKLYYWNSSRFYVSGNQYGTYGGESTCNKIFEVDDENNIIKWQWEGNSCPCTYYGVKKLVNPKNNYWEIKKYEKNNKN